MSKPILAIGKSGSGKSRAILNLNPAKTFIINVNGKDLPFRGWRKNYTPLNKEGKGNIVSFDNHEKIRDTLNFINDKRPDIEVIIIDDFQYIMANEFMRRAKEKGFEKFTEIGQHAWDLLFQSRMLRNDLFVVFLAHSDTDDQGNSKCKTIGKLLDDKICVEGMFTIVLNTAYEDGKYFFETQTNGNNTTKSPEGMFSTNRIENDLNLVITSIKKYEGE
jgi:hypothetical protein